MYTFLRIKERRIGRRLVLIHTYTIQYFILRLSYDTQGSSKNRIGILRFEFWKIDFSIIGNIK